jgi:hypothetical protein
MKEKTPDKLIVHVTEEYIEKVERFWRSIEELVDAQSDGESDLPKWVNKIQSHLKRTVYLQLENIKSGYADPRKIGITLGFMKKIQEILTESVERLDKVPVDYKVPPDLTERWDTLSSSVNELLVPEDDYKGIRIYAYGFLVESYTSWNWQDSREFHLGMAEGLKGIKDPDNAWVNARMNTDILIHLLWNWRFIEHEIQSVAALHRWLLNYFQKPQLGEQKRLEKICERISLKLAPVGRPKKKAAKKAKKKIPTKRKRTVGIKKK